MESIRTMYSAYFDLDLNSLKWAMLKEDIVAVGQNATQLGDFLEIRAESLEERYLTFRSAS